MSLLKLEFIYASNIRYLPHEFVKTRLNMIHSITKNFKQKIEIGLKIECFFLIFDN